MWSRWCSDGGRRAFWLAATLSIGCLGSTGALAHPELMAQIERLDAQIVEQPADADLLIQRGDLYRRHGDFAEARRDLAAARTLDPGNKELDFYEGRLQLQSGDAKAADASFSRYLDTFPRHAAAWSLRGRARQAQGQYLLAAADFAAAIECSQSPTPSLYLEQALALVGAGEAHWKAALAAVDAGLAQHSRDVALLGLAADIALTAGQTGTVGQYIDPLPPALLQLPQWRDRSQSLLCLQSGAAVADCAVAARGRLDDQLRNSTNPGRMDSE